MSNEGYATLFVMENFIETFVIFASIVPALCSICYGVMLISKRESKVKCVLGLLFFVSGLCWGNSMLVDNLFHEGNQVPVFTTWHMLSNLLDWPILGWYLALLFHPDSKFYPTHFNYFIPFLIALPCTIIIRAIWGTAPDVYSISEFFPLIHTHPEFILRILMLIIFITLATWFFIRAENDLKRYKQRIKSEFSALQGINFRWVQIVNFLFFTAAGTNFGLALAGEIHTRMWLGIWEVLFLTFVAIVGGTKKDLYLLPEKNGSAEGDQFNASVDIKDLKISDTALEKIRTGLIEAIEIREVYTIKNLSLDDLAQMLNTNKTYVSAVINHRFGSNFYTLINRYRIKKALELLSQPHVQIKSIWSLTGFNSQSSFNSAFKKEKSMSPSEWRRSVLSDQHPAVE